MKKRRILLGVSVLGAMVALSMFYLLGSAGAETQTVTPSVEVESALSLTLEDTGNVQWVDKAAGSTITGTIVAVVGGNTQWNLTVRATGGYTETGELVSGSFRIPGANFTYTSAAGATPPSNGTGVTTDTQFDESTESAVWTIGSAHPGCDVAITYTLQVPLNQPIGTYTTEHTYTALPL